MRFIAVIVAVALAGSASSSSTLTSSAAEHPLPAYGRLPLSFEANQGQSDPQVDFLSRAPGYTVLLSSNEAVLVVQEAALRMTLIDANEHAEAVSSEPLPGIVNYMVGADPTRWRTGIPTHAKATYREIYRGIDIVYYGNQGQLEYDFILQPGASAETITLQFDGATQIEVDGNGELLLHTRAGVIRNSKPRIYQVIDGDRQAVTGGYTLDNESRVGFNVGDYDEGRPLVIDPTLIYSTHLGGPNADSVAAIAVDAAGSVYVAGTTTSTAFPATPGAFDTTFNDPVPPYGFGSGMDVVVAKLNATGSALEPAVLLPPDRHRFCESVLADL